MMGRKRVIVWGCGTIGKKVFCYLYDKFDMEVIAYTQSDVESRGGGHIYNVPIIEKNEILNIEVDYVLIAVYSFTAIKEIINELDVIGVPKEKIKPIALGLDFADAFMDQRIYWIRDFSIWCYEQKIQGNVAECGVFRGDSARFINKYFYDRKLYLFDTFEGFEKADIEYELDLGNLSYNNGRFVSDITFKDTDMEYLLSKMQYPDNIQIYKGYFPDTAKGIMDKFCFVNLDMDLYLPMLEALRFFWDKMLKGGCILMHDYYHSELPGVRKAITDFEKEREIVINKITIGDGCSIALMK